MAQAKIDLRHRASFIHASCAICVSYVRAAKHPFFFFSFLWICFQSQKAVNKDKKRAQQASASELVCFVCVRTKESNYDELLQKDTNKTLFPPSPPSAVPGTTSFATESSRGGGGGGVQFRN